MKTIEAFLSDLRRRDINLWLDGNDLCYKAPSQILTPALRQELKERKAEILTFLHNANTATHSNLPPILPAPRDKDLPLSFAQQRLWFLDQLEPNSSAYNMPAAYRLTGQLNIPALKQSLSEIIRRHEVLRLTFPAVDGQPSQAITPSIILTLPIIDLGKHPETEREAIAQHIATKEAKQRFDLASDPLFRAKLLRLTEAEYVLLLTIHHIVYDGWSYDIFFRELATLYDTFSSGKTSPLPKLPIQYADFAHWQHEWLQGEVLEFQLNYWKQQLSGSLLILQLPTDYPRPPVQTYQGAYQSLELSLDLTKALKALSQQESVTLFMTLLAAFQTLLSRYSGQEDIIVGTPIAGRNQVETEGLIGFFVNTLAIRTNLSGNPSFRQLLSQVREVTLGAYEHQDLPFEKLVEELQPDRDLSRSPLFQVMFVFQNTPSQPWELPELTITPLEVHSSTAKFDLTLALEETSQGIKGGIEYNTDLFEGATITRMLGHFQILLEGIVANPEQHLWDLPLLTTAEQHQLLVEWNSTQTDYPNNTCIHQLFEAQAERTPDAIAVVFENEQLTYQQLNRCANQLAHYLQNLGVKPDTLVGICVERSLEMLIGLLGILKAGGVYVPLDPAYPQERLAFMLQDIQASVLLTQQQLVENLPPHEAHVVCLDTDWEAIARERAENLEQEVTLDNLVYTIYTSGSTGKPKGIAMSHHCLSNLISWQLQNSTVRNGAKTLQFTSLSFDVSCQEIFSTWCSGGTLVLISEELRRDAVGLLRFLTNERIERLFLPFVALQQLAEVADTQGLIASSLIEIITAGEQLQITPQLANLFKQLKGCTLHNQYGPAESHVVTAFTLEYSPPYWPVLPPLGRPIANTQIYILDSYLQPVPVGVPGELHIGGVGLARGYLNRPELTEEKFIPNPFQRSRGAEERGSKGAKEDLSSNPERLYKTGDLARYLPDGTIEFLGRLDNQVKIRGFRIEEGEIEAVIAQHSNVQQTVVTARDDSLGDKRLVAYIVLSPEQTLTPDELRRFLKQKLPDYMMPSAFVFLDALPLTPNGKVDRRALPLPEQARQEPEETFVAPRDELELQLTKTWEKVLGIQPISVKDNFFALGGHSLLAVRLFAQIEKIFGKNLSLATLFQAPTVEQLASILRAQGWLVPESSLVPIQIGNSKPPFFFINSISYAKIFGSYLGYQQPFYCLNIFGLTGIFEKQLPHLQIEEIAQQFIKDMRTIQPDGPYLLGTYCGDGKLAFEMAQQLHKQGQKVALLAFIDVIWDAPNRGLYFYWHNFCQFGLNYLIEKAKNKLKFTKHKLVILTKSIKGKFYSKARHPLPRNLQDVNLLKAFYQATATYVPQVYPGQITLFLASEWQLRNSPKLESLAAGGLEIQEIHGYHHSMFEEPQVLVLAEKLKACIDRVQADDLAHIPSLCSDPFVCDNEEAEG